MADAGGIRAGRAYVEIGANDSQLQKGLKAAEAKVKAFGDAVTSIGTKLGAVGAAITAPLVAATAKFAESGSALQHMSERTGVSVEALSTLGFAAKQSGTDMETVEIGIRKLQKALVAGSEENQQAAGTFAFLGLSIQNLARLNPEEQFQVLAKRIAEIKDPTARAGAAMQVFGRSGTALIPLIENLDELSKEARDFGLVTSKEVAQGAQKLEQSMSLLSAVIGKIVTTIGSALAPTFEAWNIQIANIGKMVKELVEKNKSLVVTISTIGFALAAAGAAFVVLGTVISGIGATFGAIATVVGVFGAALGLLATPIGGFVIGVAAMTTALGKWGETSAAVMGLLKSQFGGLLETAQQTFKGISDAITAGDISLAGQILWAGLKVEFIKGQQYIVGVWDTIKSTAIEAFASTSTGVQATMNELWALLQIGAVKAAFAISDVFANIVDNIKIGFAVMGNFVANAWDNTVAVLSRGMIEFARLVEFEYVKIKNLVTGVALDAAAHGKALADVNARAATAQQNIDENLAARKQARSQAKDQLIDERDAGVEERKKGRQETLDQIDQNRQGAQEELFSRADEAKKARQKAAQDKAVAAASELADAQKNLAKLTTDAKVLALGKGEKGLAIPGAARGEGGEGLTPEGLDKGLEEAKAKTEVKGSFSAAQIAGLGAGESIQQEAVKEQKKTNDQLEKLNHKADQGRLVFAT